MNHNSVCPIARLIWKLKLNFGFMYSITVSIWGQNPSQPSVTCYWEPPTQFALSAHWNLITMALRSPSIALCCCLLILDLVAAAPVSNSIDNTMQMQDFDSKHFIDKRSHISIRVPQRPKRLVRSEALSRGSQAAFEIRQAWEASFTIITDTTGNSRNNLYNVWIEFRHRFYLDLIRWHLW